MKYHLFFFLKHFTLGLLISMHGSFLLSGQHADPVSSAFRLRMNGMVDSAKVVLENTLEIDSSNALAWFELYRTAEHRRNGNPQTIMDTKESKKYLAKALQNDPHNPYYIYLNAQMKMLDYYIKLMTQENKEGLAEMFLNIEKMYCKAADMDPTYLPGKLTLVEIFAQMPPEMGGDSGKAEKYIAEMEKAGGFLGAKARSMKLSEGQNEIDYWKEVEKIMPGNADVSEMIGRSYLTHEGDATEATKYFDRAIELDPDKKDLYVVLGRFHMMEARQNFEKKDSILAIMDQRFREFLDMTPKVSNVMKAWTLSKLAQGKMFAGQQEEGQKLMAKAKALDPYFPIAFAAPTEELPPKEAHTKVVHGYFLRPF